MWLGWAERLETVNSSRGARSGIKTRLEGAVVLNVTYY